MIWVQTPRWWSGLIQSLALFLLLLSCCKYSIFHERRCIFFLFMCRIPTKIDKNFAFFLVFFISFYLLFLYSPFIDSHYFLLIWIVFSTDIRYSRDNIRFGKNHLQKIICSQIYDWLILHPDNIYIYTNTWRN